MVREFLAFILVCFVFGGIAEARPWKKNYSAAHVPSQLIIKFKNNTTAFVQNDFLSQRDAEVVRRFKSNGAMLVRFPQGFMDDNAQGLKKVIDEISARPDVEYVEPNWIVHARIKEPNDPRYEDLYALKKSRSKNADIGAPEAWSKTTGSKNVLVAVIDSGVDYNHEDLKDNYWHNPGENGRDANGKNKNNNGIDDDGNGLVDDWGGWNFIKNNNNPMDDNYHGTHCAGTIGASGNNGIGVVGINWNVSIVGLKFLDKEGNGSVADAVTAVEYAMQIGVDVMSNSWGGDEYSETLAAAIKKASAKGILFVVAAGNNSSNNDTNMDYPSSYQIDNIVTVAATDSEGELAGFSNFGAKTVHIAAPGAQILSTFPGNKYDYLDGTSMAAPLVAGSAALIKARFPSLKAREIKARLLGGAVHTKALEGKVITGLLNVNNALNDDVTPPAVPTNISVTANFINSAEIEFQPAADNGQDKFAYEYEIRRSSSAINSESDWNKADTVSKIFLQNDSTKVKIRVDDLPLNSSGYFAVRALDRGGNLSEISDAIPYSTKRSSEIYANKNNSLDGLDIEGSWGTESVSGMGKVLSDSPGDVYGYGITSSLTLPVIAIRSNDVVLAFKGKYEFEQGFDFGYVEVSVNGGSDWKQVAQFSGAQGWMDQAYSLKSVLKDGKANLLVRFRITSDSTHSMDGWLLSGISVYN
ncbi:MAG: S8 family serine peptidase [Bdellovibrio sp.]